MVERSNGAQDEAFWRASWSTKSKKLVAASTSDLRRRDDELEALPLRSQLGILLENIPDVFFLFLSCEKGDVSKNRNM